MGLVVKHCVTCGSEKLVVIGGCVWSVGSVVRCLQ